MSVEQTTQLIQLILNSVLMGVVCALVLGGLTARHASLGDEINAFNQSRDQDKGPEDRHQVVYQRQQRRSLYNRYRLSRYSVLTAYYALLFAIFSGLMLALRGMLEWDWLIPVALSLFAVGISTLLVSVGLTLVEWHFSNRPLLDEAAHLLSMGRIEKQVRSRTIPRRAAPLATRSTRGQVFTPPNQRRAG
jgi:hypothetical protein